MTETPTTLVPKRPPAHWTRLPADPRVRHIERYLYAGLLVFSELSDMEAPDGSKELIPQWLVTVSKSGRRVSDRDLERVRRAFDMEGAEEDNHAPGITRALFLTVDPGRRVECECKTEETIHVEPDGYRWSSDADPEKCGACMRAEAVGESCPVHGRGATPGEPK